MEPRQYSDYSISANLSEFAYAQSDLVSSNCQGYDTWRVTESYFSGGNEKANKSENISTLANIFVFE